jgi:hypothetical protein
MGGSGVAPYRAQTCVGATRGQSRWALAREREPPRLCRRVVTRNYN